MLLLELQPVLQQSIIMLMTAEIALRMRHIAPCMTYHVDLTSTKVCTSPDMRRGLYELT